MKEKKEKLKNKKEKADKEPNKFIQFIKRNWLVNEATTLSLILIIIAIFIAINIGMNALELTPIDFSQEKLYTLTEESKEQVKDIDKDVKIYFVGYSESDSDLDLAKQYNKANEKIVVEAVSAENRPDLVEKYGIESGSQGIIIECGEKFKVLSSTDLVTYDTTTYETISIAEEKLTSSIKSVTSDKIPKVYFLKGYSDYSLTDNMNYLNVYLENEVNEVETLDILSTGKVPDDCDTLVITTPNKDFDDIATNAIIKYINSGKNILWLNSAVSTKKDMTNVNKILALYGVNPFDIGIIIETDTSKMVSGYQDVILPEIQNAKVTKDFYSSNGAIFINATKININEDALENLNVVKTDLMIASEKSFFRTDFTVQSSNRQEGEQEGEFIVGAELEKEITPANEEQGVSAVKSKMIIYGENNFIVDYPLIQTSQYPAIQLGNNKDVVLNSIAYLVDREENITARKNTGTVTYTATEEQDTIIKIIIFAVPILIIIIGIVVWQLRRRKK